MIVLVNNTALELKTQEGIMEIFRLINMAEFKGIAVAVNNFVVPKSQWIGFPIKENDQVTIIRATQGG